MNGRRYATLEKIKTTSKKELKEIKNDIFGVLQRLKKLLAQVCNVSWGSLCRGQIDTHEEIINS